MIRRMLMTAAVLSAAVLLFTGCASKELPENDQQEPVTEEMAGPNADKVPDATAPVLEMAVVYAPSSGSSGLVQIPDGAEKVDAENLFLLMAENGAVPSEAGYEDFSVDNNAGTLTVSGLGAADTRTLAAITNTMTENLGLASLTIISDGAVLIENDAYHEDFKTLQ